MAMALNPLAAALTLSRPPPPAAAAEAAAPPPPPPARGNQFVPDGDFAIVSSSDGSDTVEMTGTKGEKGVVEAKTDSTNPDGSSRSSGTAFGDSTVGDVKPTPPPEPEETNGLLQFFPSKPKKNEVTVLNFDGPSKEVPVEEVVRPLTAQEQTNAQFASLLAGNP
jgi:hypothetical protein